MIKRFLESIISYFGILRTIQATLAGCVAILFVAAISRLFIPVHLEQPVSQVNTFSELAASESISKLLDENKSKKQWKIEYRPGMFKPATGLRDKPLADKTIERIKDQLKLQCLMEINSQPVAYINIRGIGLRKCCVGENINDLFTVLDIDNQGKSVDISIIDHKVTLRL